MEALILLTLIGILWLVSSRRWRRKFVKPIAILFLAYVITTSSLTTRLAIWGLTATLPADTGETTDAIVVLGRGAELQNRRTELAYKLWSEKRAPQVFVSGMMDSQPTAERLIEMGIPESKISGENCSQSTEENALYTSAILYPKGIHKVLLLTDPPHMQRSLLLFRSNGFTVLPALSPLPSNWDSFKQINVITREYLGLVYYWFFGRFKQRSMAEIEHPPAEILQKFTSWNCRIRGSSFANE